MVGTRITSDFFGQMYRYFTSKKADVLVVIVGFAFKIRTSAISSKLAIALGLSLLALHSKFAPQQDQASSIML